MLPIKKSLEACQAYDKRMRADADNYVALQANPIDAQLLLYFNNAACQAELREMEAKFEQAGELSLLNDGGLDVDCVFALFLAEPATSSIRSGAAGSEAREGTERNRVLSNLNAQNEGVRSTCFFLRFRTVRNYIKVYSKRGYLFNQKIGLTWSNPIPMISNDY